MQSLLEHNYSSIAICHTGIINLSLSIFLYVSTKDRLEGSASKPTLRQDTGYMVEKTYHDIAPYLGAFRAYVMPQ